MSGHAVLMCRVQAQAHQDLTGLPDAILLPGEQKQHVSHQSRWEGRCVPTKKALGPSKCHVPGKADTRLTALPTYGGVG